MIVKAWKGGLPVEKTKGSDDICCLTLPLKLEKWQEDRLARRLELARQIYNTLMHAELKKLRNVQQSPEYRRMQAEMRALDWKKEAAEKAV